jgi:hypothetical protein
MKTQILPFKQIISIAALHAGWLRVIFILVFLTFFSAVSVAQSKQWDKTFGGSDLDGLNALQRTSDGGYILGGYSYSLISGEKTEDPKGSSDYWVVKVDSAGNKEWDKTFGGNDYDELNTLQQTRDGGYILGGWSNSPLSGDKTEGTRGTYDFWILKLDSSGEKQWDKTFGGSNIDFLASLQQTRDGGYILGGWSNSPLSGDKTEGARGTTDFWVLKLDSTGKKLWDKTLGGMSGDQLTSIQQTRDGGYILGGGSDSDISGDKTQASKGAGDFWIVKLDPAGEKQWDKALGGSSGDWLNALQQTGDGGYILGGRSVSGISGDKTEASRELMDYWVVKVDSTGIKQWDKTLGGNNYDELNALQQTQDGGYILGGYSVSGISGDKTEANKAACTFFECPGDYWVVKLDATGQQKWDKTLGGPADDALTGLLQTSDGHYILGGTSSSEISGDKTEPSRGFGDFWVLKLQEAVAPQLQSFSPQQGLPGRSVSIAGKYLATTNAVLFNGIAAKFTVLSDTSLNAIVPPTVTGRITLVTAGGTVTSDRSFTVQQPRIQAFLPHRGAVGTTVILLGDRFSTVQEIRFNGSAATNFKVYFDFLLTAVVPAGATTGKISLVLRGGGQATSRSAFTVLTAAPKEAAPRAEAVQPQTNEKIPETAFATALDPPAYPNPFTRSVTIPLVLRAPATVQLSIYSQTGQLVKQVTSNQLPAGMQQLDWDGHDGLGRPVAKGLYFYRLLVNGQARTGKILKTDGAR